MRSDISNPVTNTLSPFQTECISVFVKVAMVLAIPKSIGEIYGLLYSSIDPLCFDDVTSRLHLSKGAASQGIRWLKSIRAIEPVYVSGERREFFVPQTELRRLISGIFADRIAPRLRESERGLSRLETAAGYQADERETAFAKTQIQRLRRWAAALEKSLPFLVRILGDR